jgi:hypothetical protein
MQGASLRHKEEGVQSFLQTERRGVGCCVTFVTQGRFRIAYATTKQHRSKTCKLLFDIIVRRALREVAVCAQVQQRKPIQSRKHVLACLRFTQRYENWTIEDWKRVIFNDETNINRSCCWIGDGDGIGPNMSIRL